MPAISASAGFKGTEEHLREKFRVPDGAVLCDKAQELAEKPREKQVHGYANMAFRMPDGNIRRVCNCTGNVLYYRDDTAGGDGTIKLNDHRWTHKNGVIRPIQTRQRVTVEGSIVTYTMRTKNYTLDFGSPFTIEGDHAVADLANGLRARLRVKGGRFIKIVGGVGHPNLPLTQDKQHYILSISGNMPNKALFSNDCSLGEVLVSKARLWVSDWRKRPITIRQRFRNGSWEKLLPVDYFENDMPWETDGDLYYTKSGNGYVESISNATWATVRADTTGAANDETNTPAFVDAKGPANYYVDRGAFPWDTTGISSASSAIINLYISSKTNNDNDGNDFYVLGESTQASDTGLSNNDIDDLLFSTAWTDSIDNGDVTTSAYNQWTMNATGLAAINGAGTTFTAMLEGHDFNNDAPGGTNTLRPEISTSPASDPYMDVTEASTSTLVNIERSPIRGVMRGTMRP